MERATVPKYRGNNNKYNRGNKPVNHDNLNVVNDHESLKAYIGKPYMSNYNLILHLFQILNLFLGKLLLKSSSRLLKNKILTSTKNFSKTLYVNNNFAW